MSIFSLIDPPMNSCLQPYFLINLKVVWQTARDFLSPSIQINIFLLKEGWSRVRLTLE